MAENSSDVLKIYIAEIPRNNIDILGEIRHWKNLLLASEENNIWLKGFTKEQANSTLLKTIPEIQIYEQKENLLFKLNHKTPTKKIKTGLLWFPIQKIITIQLPEQNISNAEHLEKIPVRIRPTDNEEKSSVLMIGLQDLEKSISNIPEFRLDKLLWTVVGNKAMIVGTPLLSYPGRTYWVKSNHILPSGYDFEFPELTNSISRSINPENDSYIFWQDNHQYLKIKKENFKPLSISSFRLTMKFL